MRSTGILLLILLVHLQITSAQTLLTADGPGDTYELITSVLAPDGNPIEVPDCSHEDFGRHIDEVYDTTLQAYVFRFHIHVTPDNDRCINFDRQRNEIKTYSKSADSLKGVLGETFEYKWKFMIDSNFQSSDKFTHLHQLKAVGGPEEGMPLITLTTRKGSPDQLELRYAPNTKQGTLKKTDLEPFKGTWLEVKETVKYSEVGVYSIEIIKIETEEVLFEYSSLTKRMWKTDANFIRPKWGIYRSLEFMGQLRDEMVYFNNFYIKEIKDTVGPVVLLSSEATEPVNDTFDIAVDFNEVVVSFSESDLSVQNGSVAEGSLVTDESMHFTASIIPEATGIVGINVDAAVVTDEAGNPNGAAEELLVMADIPVTIHRAAEAAMQIFPNPSTGLIHILIDNNARQNELSVFDQSGRILYFDRFTGSVLNLDMSAYKSGVYFIRLKTSKKVSVHKLFLE